MQLCTCIHCILGYFVPKRPLNAVIIQVRTTTGRHYGYFISDPEMFTVKKCKKAEVSYKKINS